MSPEKEEYTFKSLVEMTCKVIRMFDKAEQVLFELLRQAPSWRKLEMVAQMNQAAQTLALSGLCQRHPKATPQELRRRLADLLLGHSLAEQVYGPLTAQEQPDAR